MKVTLLCRLVRLLKLGNFSNLMSLFAYDEVKTAMVEVDRIWFYFSNWMPVFAYHEN